MKHLWKYINKSNITQKARTYLYLTLATISWNIIGFAVWYLIHFFALDSIVWAICFSGYSGFFLGFVNGVMFLSEQDY